MLDSCPWTRLVHGDASPLPSCGGGQLPLAPRQYLGPQGAPSGHTLTQERMEEEKAPAPRPAPVKRQPLAGGSHEPSPGHTARAAAPRWHGPQRSGSRASTCGPQSCPGAHQHTTHLPSPAFPGERTRRSGRFPRMMEMAQFIRAA